MAIKKPIIAGSGDELLEQLQVGDTLSTEDITDSTDKRFVTDLEKAAIGASANPSVIIQDTEPATNCLWLQTNVDGDPNSFMFWLKG